MLTVEKCGRICRLSGKQQHADHADRITAVYKWPVYSKILSDSNYIQHHH